MQAKPILEMLDLLVQFSIVGQDQRRATALLADREHFIGFINPLLMELQAPDFDMCRVSAQRLIEHIRAERATAQILSDVNELRVRLLDQLGGVYCLRLSNAEKEYFEPV